MAKSNLIDSIKGGTDCREELTGAILSVLKKEERRKVPLYNLVFDCDLEKKECSMTIRWIDEGDEPGDVAWSLLPDRIFELELGNVFFKEAALSLFFHAVDQPEIQEILDRMEKEDDTLQLLLPYPYWCHNAGRQSVSYVSYLEFRELFMTLGEEQALENYKDI